MIGMFMGFGEKLWGNFLTELKLTGKIWWRYIFLKSKKNCSLLFLLCRKDITFSCATSPRSGRSGLCAFYKYATSPRSGLSGLRALYKYATSWGLVHRALCFVQICDLFEVGSIGALCFLQICDLSEVGSVGALCFL